jgi:DnaK suppressor protein
MGLGLDEACSLLLVRLAKLREEDRRAAESTAPVTLEQDSVGRLSRIDAMQMQAMALASQRRRSTEKRQIEAALRRIDSGDYGYCTACGEDIPEARLRHSPAVTKCVECAD